MTSVLDQYRMQPSSAANAKQISDTPTNAALRINEKPKSPMPVATDKSQLLGNDETERRTEKQNHHQSNLLRGPIQAVLHDMSHKPDSGSPIDSRPGVGACILVTDDDHLIDEWLAYHYHMLRLRHVIIETDASSNLNAAQLATKWRPLGLDIEQWVDAASVPSSLPNLLGDKMSGLSEEEQTRRNAALYRHRRFETNCAKALRKRNMAWTLFADADEFVVLHPDVVKREFPTIASDGNSNEALSLRKDILADTIEVMAKEDPGASTCVKLTRFDFGTTETDDLHKRMGRTDDVASLDLSKLQTLRYKFRSAEGRDKGMTKSFLLDISQFASLDQNYDFDGYHPVENLCPGAHIQMGEDPSLKNPFAVNRYVGTWEHYQQKHGAGASLPVCSYCLVWFFCLFFARYCLSPFFIYRSLHHFFCLSRTTSKKQVKTL